MLENGQARDLADLARKFSLTRARVTQILAYTLLAPDIQREILVLPPVEPGREPIREPEMRAVLREVLDRAAKAVARAHPSRCRDRARCREHDAVSDRRGPAVWPARAEHLRHAPASVDSRASLG
jgi:hypothetical protein